MPAWINLAITWSTSCLLLSTWAAKDEAMLPLLAEVLLEEPGRELQRLSCAVCSRSIQQPPDSPELAIHATHDWVCSGHGSVSIQISSRDTFKYWWVLSIVLCLASPCGALPTSVLSHQPTPSFPGIAPIISSFSLPQFPCRKS